MSLLTSNSIRLSVNGRSSEPIAIRRSVPQGGPMSPILYNLATDFIFRDVCEPDFANAHGYPLRPGMTAIALNGFADDKAATSTSTEGATRIVELVHNHLQKIGLGINPRKSVAIIIKDGRLVEGELMAIDGEPIRSIKKDERIRYLGCAYENELVFDSSVIAKLTNQMNNLIESPLLQKDQKVAVLNQYLLPQMIYPLQAAPINKIPKQHLASLDITIRQTAKAIIGLPISSTANSMLYAPRKYRGLGLVCAQDEVQIQHFAIAGRLDSVQDELFQEIFNGEQEQRQCKEALGVDGETAKDLRKAIRQREFEKWAEMPYAGVGVRHFKNHPPSNRFVYKKSGLSGSEWTAALKLSSGYANLAGVPGNAQASSRRCRKGDGEIETIGHVLGACKSGENRRIARHHRLKHELASLLKEKGFYTIDEVPCKDAAGSNRFVDILAFDPSGRKAFIIDPTIRYESNREVDEEVQKEKEEIYLSCIPDLKEKYRHLGEREFEVIGVWLGARGAIGKSLIRLFDRFNLPTSRIPELAEKALADSVRMIHYHIYS